MPVGHSRSLSVAMASKLLAIATVWEEQARYIKLWVSCYTLRVETILEGNIQ